MLKIGQIVTHMKWHLVPAEAGTTFVTSDNPVAIGRWLNPDQIQFGSPLLDPMVFLTFPIARDLCFVADWRGNDCDYLPPLDGLVRLANTKRVAFAHEHLFSGEKELLDIGEVRRTRAAMCAIATPFDEELSLVPPDHLALAGLRPITEMLLEKLREASLPVEPFGG